MALIRLIYANLQKIGIIFVILWTQNLFLNSQKYYDK